MLGARSGLLVLWGAVLAAMAAAYFADQLVLARWSVELDKPARNVTSIDGEMRAYALSACAVLAAGLLVAVSGHLLVRGAALAVSAVLTVEQSVVIYDHICVGMYMYSGFFYSLLALVVALLLSIAVTVASWRWVRATRASRAAGQARVSDATKPRARPG